MCPTWKCQSCCYWFCWTEQTSRPRRYSFEFIRSLQRGLQKYICQPERSISHHSNEEITCLNPDLSPKCCKQWKHKQEPCHKASLDWKRLTGFKVLQWRRGSGACTSVTYRLCSLDECVCSEWTCKGSESLKSSSCIRRLVCWVECVKVSSRLWNCGKRNCRSGGFIFSFL